MDKQKDFTIFPENTSKVYWTGKKMQNKQGDTYEVIGRSTYPYISPKGKVEYPYFVIRFEDTSMCIVTSGNIRKGTIKHPHKLPLTTLSFEEAISTIKPPKHMKIHFDKEAYINTNSTAVCECLIHGEKWPVTIISLRKKVPQCAVCNNQKSRTFKELQTIASEKNITLKNPQLGTENNYIVNSAYLEAKCNVCQHTWSLLVGRLVIGVGCPDCGGTRKLSFKEVKHKIENAIGKVPAPLTVLSTGDNYKNVSSRIHVKCLIDGYEWRPKANYLLSGSGCPECGKRKHNGGFTFKNAEKNKESWIKIPYTVYVVKIFNDEEEFYKIGVTHTKVSHRLIPKKLEYAYKYESLKEIKVSKYHACYLEAFLHEAYKKDTYSPKVKFPGHTECFITLKDLEAQLEKQMGRLPK